MYFLILAPFSFSLSFSFSALVLSYSQKNAHQTQGNVVKLKGTLVNSEDTGHSCEILGRIIDFGELSDF